MNCSIPIFFPIKIPVNVKTNKRTYYRYLYSVILLYHKFISNEGRIDLPGPLDLQAAKALMSGTSLSYLPQTLLTALFLQLLCKADCPGTMSND